MTIEELTNQILQTMNDYQIPAFFKDKIVNIIDKYITEQEPSSSCCDRCGYTSDEDD